MKIDFTLTKEDYIAYNLHHIQHSPSLKKSLNIQRYGLALIFLIFPFIIASMTPIPLFLWLLVYGSIFIVWIKFYPKYFVSSTKKRILRLIEEGNSANLLGERSILVTEEAVEEITPQGESRTTWGSIERIDETDDYIYIYTSPINAYLVPTRAFEETAQKNEFLQLLRNHGKDQNQKPALIEQ
jgi:hypothetical protein